MLPRRLRLRHTCARDKTFVIFMIFIIRSFARKFLPCQLIRRPKHFKQTFLKCVSCRREQQMHNCTTTTTRIKNTNLRGGLDLFDLLSLFRDDRYLLRSSSCRFGRRWLSCSVRWRCPLLLVSRLFRRKKSHYELRTTPWICIRLIILLRENNPVTRSTLFVFVIHNIEVSQILCPLG